MSGRRYEETLMYGQAIVQEGRYAVSNWSWIAVGFLFLKGW